jgi:hypothetical protein
LPRTFSVDAACATLPVLHLLRKRREIGRVEVVVFRYACGVLAIEVLAARRGFEVLIAPS